MTPVDLVLEGTLAPAQTLTYIHLPFSVPDGIERIEVTYEYDSAIGSDPHLTNGNTIDIGIFDPRGIDFLDAGFRGWSGSARDHFFIATDDSTPGYMPGPLQSGTWHICLGAYKVAPDGCHYRVSIRLTPAETPQQHDFPPRLTLDPVKTAAPRADGWYRGELHCHTVNSDGDSTVAEIVRQAETLGLDFLAITDHNNLTHQVDLARVTTDVLLIPGLEVTTYHGHWNIWGDGDWIDFRVETANDMQRAITQASRQGYLVSCNHPRPFGPEWEYADVSGYVCVEVWNGPWELLNDRCLAFWDERLKRGERLTAVGGSDHHFSHQPHIARLGHPTTFIHAPQPPSAHDVLTALRAGRAFISEAPHGARLWLSAGSAQMGDVIARPPDDMLLLDVQVHDGVGALLEVCGAGGVLATLPIVTDETTRTLPITLGGSPYVRAQLRDPSTQHMRALTNPLYVEG